MLTYCPMKLSMFPFDHQKCYLALESCKFLVKLMLQDAIFLSTYLKTLGMSPLQSEAPFKTSEFVMFQLNR